MIIWHLSWHFVPFFNSKLSFHWNFNIFVTKPITLCEKSAESRLSVCYHLAGISHYFEANGLNSIWFCLKGQLKLTHFLLPRYSVINIKSYLSEIINVLCRTCLSGKLEQGGYKWSKQLILLFHFNLTKCLLIEYFARIDRKFGL